MVDAAPSDQALPQECDWEDDKRTTLGSTNDLSTNGNPQKTSKQKYSI